MIIDGKKDDTITIMENPPTVDFITPIHPCTVLKASDIADPTTGKNVLTANLAVFNVNVSAELLTIPWIVNNPTNIVSKKLSDTVTTVFTPFDIPPIFICDEVDPIKQNARYIASSGIKIVLAIREIICTTDTKLS